MSKRQELKALIKQHGSAYRAAIAIGITPQSFYERMHRVGLKPKGHTLLKGEPLDHKDEWLKQLLMDNDCNIHKVARLLKRSESAIRQRMKTYGLECVIE